MIAYPKQPRIEIPRLLELARIVPRPCLLAIPGVCSHPGREHSCCACHGNLGEFGKARGMKAHDFFSVWGCARCHNWLDSSYSASGVEREQAFRRALVRQIVEWAKIVASPLSRPKDAAACLRALEELTDRGYARLDPVLCYVPVPVGVVHA